MSSYLRALRLVNFRNYADATVLLAPGLNLLDNRTGGPEPLAPVQEIDYDRLIRGFAAAVASQPAPVVRVDTINRGQHSARLARS